LAESLTNKQLVLIFILVLIAGIILGSGSLLYPFGRDQGIYAYAGQLLLQGKIDYKYVFDLKPPGVHFVFALGQLIFGKSMIGMRMFDILWQSVTGFVLFIIIYKLTKSKLAGLLSSVLYIFLYYRLDYWHTLQADGFLNLPFALSILFVLISYEKKYAVPLLTAGALFGITILFKYTLIIFLPLLIIIFIFQPDSQNRIKKIFLYLGGFVIINLLAASLYLFAGALDEFIDIQFVQTLLYAKIGYETESTGFITANVLRLFFGSVYSPLIWFSVLLAIYLLTTKQFSYKYSVIFGWIASSIIGLIIQWKFFLYHFLVIIPAISAGASLFIANVNERYRKRFRIMTPISCAIILVCYFSFGFKPYISNYADLSDYLKGSKTINQLYEEKGFTNDSAFMIAKTFRAIEFVKQNTSENSGIYVWGFDPLIYYLSGRHCISRFVYNFPLYWKENNEKFQTEFMKDLNKEKPELILVSQHDPLYFISGFKGDSKDMLERVPGFKTFIEQNYEYAARIDDFSFFKIRNNPEIK
jgi:hypothetical protein